jgi:A/G-specific adenine glycosylase
VTDPILFSEISRRLVIWHGEHQRVLPWRDAPAGQRDPYSVWVSEIMLQQTRVETVAAYYRRWMARLPSLEALAATDLQEVLKLWEGLGYYARARNLHRAARQVASNHAGKLPADRRALLALPGIGEYTAGAILSLAFNQPEPILDGNVKRVLSRLADIDQPINQPATLAQLWRLAREMVEAAPVDSAGVCNEALMELGATICTPENPRCLICPLVDLCAAARHGTQHERPVTPPRKSTPHVDVAAGVIWQGEAFHSPLLVSQRPAHKMLGGLWEFPGGKLEPSDANLPTCLQREIAEELGIEIAVGEQFIVLHHAFTHFRMTMHVFHARHTGGEPQAIGCADWRWLSLDQLDALPFPVTDQKIIAALRKNIELEPLNPPKSRQSP